MNFEDAFKHYQEGTATAEEKEYVTDELAKAKAFSPLLDDEGLNVTPVTLAEADIRDVRMAKKQFKWRKLVTGISGIGLTLVLIAMLLGTVFGIASNFANQNIVYNREESVVFAKNYAFDFLQKSNANFPSFVTSVDEIVVVDIDKDFHYNASKIERSYYAYSVEMVAGAYKIYVEVDARASHSCIIENIH